MNGKTKCDTIGPLCLQFPQQTMHQKFWEKNFLSELNTYRLIFCQYFLDNKHNYLYRIYIVLGITSNIEII